MSLVKIIADVSGRDNDGIGAEARFFRLSPTMGVKYYIDDENRHESELGSSRERAYRACKLQEVYAAKGIAPEVYGFGLVKHGGHLYWGFLTQIAKTPWLRKDENRESMVIRSDRMWDLVRNSEAYCALRNTPELRENRDAHYGNIGRIGHRYVLIDCGSHGMSRAMRDGGIRKMPRPPKQPKQGTFGWG